MAKKRRMFSIDMPTEAAPVQPAPEAPAPATQSRRGPMASAISEAAESHRQRQEIEAQIRAENDALAHEHVRLKNMGLIIELVPIDAIHTDKLVRDRAVAPDPELAELKDSIVEIGLSNPIRVEARDDGGYELIQGFRRLCAYKELAKTLGQEKWSVIPAVVTSAGDTLEDLYRRMVDENLVRKDISFAEMAQLALEYARDPATEEQDPDKVVALLFKSAGYQKRSYIRSFIKLIDALGDDLRHPTHLPRALGLALVALVERAPADVDALRAKLAAMPERSVSEELDLLRAAVGVTEKATPETAPKVPAPSVKPARLRLGFERNGTSVQCTAVDGKLEIKTSRDFSALDAAALERALAEFLDQLDGGVDS